MSEELKMPRVIPDSRVPEGVVLLLNEAGETRRVVEIVEENATLRARVAELEKEVLRLCLSIAHEGPSVAQRVLRRSLADRAATAAPAPGRDTTTSRDLAAGGTDGE